MFCTRCGADNAEEAKFCRNCAAPLTRPGAGSSGSQAGGPPPLSERGASGNQPYPGYQGYQSYPQAQSGYSGAPMAQQGSASGRASAALVLGIIGLVSCCLPAGVIGAVLGKLEMNAIRDGRAPRAGETIAKIGFWLGIVSTVLSLIVSAFYFLGMLASIAGGGRGGY
jgi:hypothetical protein